MSFKFLKKENQDYRFDNRYNMDRRIITINLPFRVSIRDYVKFKNDQYNINNKIKSCYINKTSIMIPHSKLIELDKLLPIFSRKETTIKKIIEFNKNLNIEAFSNSKIYIKESSIANGVYQLELSKPIINFVESNKVGMVYINTATFQLPHGLERKPEISFLSYTKWNLLDINLKYNSTFPIPPDFCIEIRSINDTFEFRQNKMIEYILQGVQTCLLIDPYHSNNIGACYYYCLTPCGRSSALIPDSNPLIDHNLNQIGVNYIEYSWSNLESEKDYFPQLKINLFGYLNGLILDLGKIKRIDLNSNL